MRPGPRLRAEPAEEEEAAEQNVVVEVEGETEGMRLSRVAWLCAYRRARRGVGD